MQEFSIRTARFLQDILREMPSGDARQSKILLYVMRFAERRVGKSRKANRLQTMRRGKPHRASIFRKIDHSLPAPASFAASKDIRT